MTTIVTTIAIISPGDMGHAIGRVILSNNPQTKRVITNLNGRSERTKALSYSAGIIDTGSDEELLRQADIILSIVSPSEAAAVAHRFSRHMSLNQGSTIYVDMNAIAPQTTCSIASNFSEDCFVDGSIVGLPPRANEYSPTIYLSGKNAQKVALAIGDTSMLDIRVLGDEIGQASGLKMCYGTMTKGITAIVLHACVAARSLKLDGAFLDELKRSMPHGFEMANRLIPDMAPKASRWVAEMEEIAKTNEEIGLTAELFQAVANTYKFVAEQTPLGNEIIEDRKRGTTLSDALDIMAECLDQKKQKLND
ncbi:unnamed protein product [Rotaria socialis]|uniref:6-phosphogluconate dehydrogenase n=2 Tax=Rotaria socialis TaxID=392032 RepID=A0A818CJ18_9BILA|nr:unnamed protein product [Rotaria socialis]